MRDAFDVLTHEHRIIEKVLLALETAAECEMPAPFYERAIVFGQRFGDGFHHAKEEERLFRYLEQRGMPRDYGPIGVMVEEHDAGREHLRAMAGQLAAGDVEALRAESLAYVHLMREHIEKEDDVLFPMGRAHLTPDEIEEIRVSYEQIPAPEPSSEFYVEEADRLLAEATAAAQA